MRGLKRSGIVALMLVGLLSASAVAMAQTDEETTEADAVETFDFDTLFTFGYDLINRILLWNVSPSDGDALCELDEGPSNVTYGETPTIEGQAEGACELTGGEVTGPAGQVNHGMFMKLFNSLYDGEHRGCVIRHLAQSDLGKGDQQVKAGEDAEFVPVAPGGVGVVDFTTIETKCGLAGEDDADLVEETVEGEAERGGRPDHAGKPENAGKSGNAGRPDSPGRSGSAPGQNK